VSVVATLGNAVRDNIAVLVEVSRGRKTDADKKNSLGKRRIKGVA